jgi:starch synthase (maltosyl-transferring)
MTVERDPRRPVITNVQPEIEGGRFPIKRAIGEHVVVDVDAFADGHDELACVLRYRHESDSDWTEVPMTPLGNDLWRAEFATAKLGRYEYTVEAWIDDFATWRRDLTKRVDAGQDVALELLIGAGLIEQAAERAADADRERLAAAATRLRGDGKTKTTVALDPELAQLVARYPDRTDSRTYGRTLAVQVDVERSRFSAWYEMFPRSASPEPGRHGTFADVEARLPYVAGMGFDVLYLPPIHPIGHTRRKGRNNAVTAGPDEPGSPWGIGAEEGGHKAVHPDLGTLDDFHRLLGRARDLGIEVALDIAFQCSADHPYLKEHPEWFRTRPDGSIQYAENPPKKYEDIYPFDFDTENWQALWDELLSVFLFWVDQGVRVFRVDNPHTKPFRFWEWVITEVKARQPDVIFLSEAFTRPKVMYHLAKLGFTQSYTYFAWRTAKIELMQYFTELTQTEVREFFRPSIWTNTPDINIEYLHSGARGAFVVRFVLAATLGANYGMYGPPFELLVGTPREPGSEEYLDSEKYEVRHWDLDAPQSIRDIIATVNRARRENPALQSDRRLRFHPVDNDQLICYSKRSADGPNIVLVVINLDPLYTQSGFLELPLADFDIDPELHYVVHDVLTDARYEWAGPRNYIELDPTKLPAHVFVVSQPAPLTRRPARRAPARAEAAP